MSDSAIQAVRWVLVALALLSALQATLLYEAFRRLVLERWLAANERVGASVPAAMRNRTLHRAWLLLMAAFFAALWWYLGTPAGYVWLRGA
jgi:hypothetical protein